MEKWIYIPLHVTTRKLKNRDGNLETKIIPSLFRHGKTFSSLNRDGKQFPSLFRDENSFRLYLDTEKFPSLNFRL